MKRSESGFTMLEAVLVIALLAPLLATILGASSTVSNTLAQTTRRAEVSKKLRRSVARLIGALRSAKRAQFTVEAVQADVDDAITRKASDPSVQVPTVGDWIAMPLNQDRTTIRFATLLQTPDVCAVGHDWIIKFVRDAKEQANSTDDDGDGLIDEGTLVRVRGRHTVKLLNNVEHAAFRMDASILRLELTCAEIMENGQVYRVSMQHSIRCRN